MQTIPYTTPDGIIDLVRKDEHDAIVQELNERLTKQQADMLDTIVKLRAELTSWQSMADRLATAFKGLMEEYEDRKCQFGSDYLWQKHEDTESIESAREALAAYESAKSGKLPDSLAEAVKRMEAVPVNELWEIYATHDSPAAYKCMGAVRARLIAAAKGEQP